MSDLRIYVNEHDKNSLEFLNLSAEDKAAHVRMQAELEHKRGDFDNVAQCDQALKTIAAAVPQPSKTAKE